ncbi:uncharacterized protein LOC106775098 isoform X2 [Vigna radiata var. radiata]|nr:uncharacterized protein LOC106775098 isoform X2 [Vigna radiata var. radiata]XP_022639912.1 uncharacterized protein LOC106775098 isoform X2 [Vigna radiata var. radiata]
MPCAPQEIGNDNPKVSEARKDSVSTIYQQQHKFTSLEGCQESSLSRINSDSRCAIISFNFEPDGTWRIVALPGQCLNYINLAAGVNMDGVQLLVSPLNRLRIDQCKGPRVPLPSYAYSAKSCTKKSFTSSNVYRRCQNKIASRASKLNELSNKSSSQSTLVCSPGFFPDSSAEVNSSDKYASNSKDDDKSLKKNSRKQGRKKFRRSKKKSSHRSTECEVPTEEVVCPSLTSETCSSNVADKDGMAEFLTSDDRLIKSDCDRNGMNDIKVMEAPNVSNSYLDQEAMLKDSAPIIPSSAAECATFESKNQLKGRGPEAVIDREIKNIQHTQPCSFNDIQDSLVLDSVSVCSRSGGSINTDDIGKQSNKSNCTTTSDSGDGYVFCQNLTNGIPNNNEHIEGIMHSGQNCIGNDKRVKQKRTMSHCSGLNKFGGVGILQGRKGKENSHSVWQKVQKNASDECGGDLKKVNTTLSQLASVVEKDPSVIKECKSVGVNCVSKTEDKKQMKNKIGKKSKVKMDSVSKKGQSNYSRKSLHLNRSLSNDHGKVGAEQNDMLLISTQEIDQHGVNNDSGFNSDVHCLLDGVQTNGVEQVTSEKIHSAEFHLEESDPRSSACHTVANTNNESIDSEDRSLVRPSENVNQSNMSVELSPASCNLEGDEVGQTEKEVSSADYNAQNQCSGTSLWKWIPIGKKDTGLEKYESSTLPPDYSDASSRNNINHESSVEPELASSESKDSSINASRTSNGEIYHHVSCLGEGENEKLGGQVPFTFTQHRDKKEVSSHMFNESKKQEMLEKDSYRISQAVNDACRVQLACEAVHMATGGPVAEFERLLHFGSPVICKSVDSVSCSTCSCNHAGGVSLCRHEIPNLSLGCLWQWYEKHGSYGLEISAQDHENPKRQGVGDFPFRAYFVPSLSAVQLFKNHEDQCVNSSDKLSNCEVSEACQMINFSENSSTATEHSIFSVLFPQPRNQDASIETPKETDSISNRSGDLELLFEYFECEQPQQRQPLYEKIQELVRGNMPIQSSTYGDPTKLDSIKLRDLHPSSWFSVAWYPIYRIPDGNFRASFLTYHSLGHLVRRRTGSDLSTSGSCIVSPAVGLQSYNDQGECWFKLKHSAEAAEMVGLDPSFVLRERLKTLEETACVMARAVVKKGNQTCTNRHPDYEFFLSRRRY